MKAEEESIRRTQEELEEPILRPPLLHWLARHTARGQELSITTFTATCVCVCV